MVQHDDISIESNREGAWVCRADVVFYSMGLISCESVVYYDYTKKEARAKFYKHVNDIQKEENKDAGIEQ